MRIDKNSRISALLSNPIGRDILGRLTQYAGMNLAIIDNPLVRNIRLSSLKKLSGGLVDDALLDDLTELFNQSTETVAERADAPAWWKEAVIYQIYPRSFRDSNGDGIGDLRGIIEKIGYLKDLGVTAVWLGPVYDSPNDDNGYDIRDYRKIMEEFGSMEDMEALIEELHANGIRLIMDLVLNHTSDEHEWFQKSKAGDPAYRDYYVWKDGEADVLPNNWSSFFYGSAWTYYEERKAHALHLFSKKQMDLNWENPAVRREVAEIAKFWREKGVDGFRLDVINLISKSTYADGNEMLGSTLGITGIEHYFYGIHLHEYLQQLRREGFADAFTVGETPGTGPEMNKLLTAPSRGELDMVFCFDHIDAQGKMRYDDYRYDLSHLKKCFLTYEGDYADYAWPSIFTDNHDNPRMVSKIDPAGTFRDPLAKLLAMLLLTARGTVFLYQGQEIGMGNVAFRDFTELRDVEGINRYRELEEQGHSDPLAGVLTGSRDHARVPMQWDGSEQAGFTDGMPWIRTSGDAARSVAAQTGDADSVLNFHRMLIALRKQIPELVYGAFEPVRPKDKNTFCYFRHGDGSCYYIETNLTETERRRPKLPKGARLLLSNYGKTAKTLRSYEANLYAIDV